MRALLVLTIAFLPLLQAQDARLLKSVEPRYDLYSQDLAADFDVATASLTLTVGADGKPLAFDSSSRPLPMAVIMALKDYEFRPQGTVPHGQSIYDGETYEVKLTVPIRQPKESRDSQNAAPVRDSSPIEADGRVRLNQGVLQGLRVKFVQPDSPEAMKHSHLAGRITFEAVITKQGEVGHLTTSAGPFLMVEAAYEAVKEWQYKPYLLRGEPIEVRAEIPINFKFN